MAIENGSKVTINYTLKVGDQVVDTSEGKDPLTYTHGMQQIIPGLEDEVARMNVGEKKQVVVTPEKGYGQPNPANVQKLPKNKFAEPEKLQVGHLIQGQAGDQQFQAVIMEIGDEEITIDMNHPLAGKTLTFDVELVGVE